MLRMRGRPAVLLSRIDIHCEGANRIIVPGGCGVGHARGIARQERDLLDAGEGTVGGREAVGWDGVMSYRWSAGLALGRAHDGP